MSACESKMVRFLVFWLPGGRFSRGSLKALFLRKIPEPFRNMDLIFGVIYHKIRCLMLR